MLSVGQIRNYDTIQKTNFNKKSMQIPFGSADFFNFRKYSIVENERLRRKYGINSNIKDEKILKSIVPLIEEFCKINENDKLFEGLSLKAEALKNTNEPYTKNSNCNTKEYTLIFNKNFNWNKIDKFTRNRYENGLCGSSNPKYYLYKGLGDYLNFDYNPYAHALNSKIRPIAEAKTKINRICNSQNYTDYNAEYIATKMCKKYVPRILGEFFEERVGNAGLKFPKSEKEKVDDLDIKFQRKEEAEEALDKYYGIKAKFNNLKSANECCSAVYSLTKAIGNNNIFKGLKIETDMEEHKYSPTAFAVTITNAGTNEGKIIINPAYNWKNADNTEEKQFEEGLYSTDKIKNLFVHELSHYLDFKGGPWAYTSSIKNSNDGKVSYGDNEKLTMEKVSSYAAKNDTEFVAEYVAGRMSGIDYPEITDRKFQNLWHGPKINFP